MNHLILAFLASFIIGIIVTPLVRHWAIAHQILDDPKRKHPAILHQFPIPRAGGIGIWIAILATSFFFLPLSKAFYAIWLASGLCVVVGTLDDKYDISPFTRLAINVVTALIIIAGGIGISELSLPFFGSFRLDTHVIPLTLLGTTHHIVPFADLFTLIWIVILMNIVNWGKGVGQLSSMGTIAGLVLAGIALKYQWPQDLQYQTALLSVILAGAALSFQPFNFPPEKMLPGYGASTLIGLMIAVLSILSGGKTATVLLVLALPMTDGIIAIVRRLANKKLPVYGDRRHIYHLLLDAGFSKRSIVLIYWVLTALLGSLALTSQTGQKSTIILLSGILTIVAFMILSMYSKKRKASG